MPFDEFTREQLAGDLLPGATLQQRIGHNKAAVALANKLARRLWAMEHHHVAFDADHISVRTA